MSAENKTATPTSEERKSAIKEYHEADGKEKKAAVVKNYPFLEQIFSTGNHS